MNLYLYLPSTSAHPPGVLKGLIYGNLQRYWNQNTYKEDFINISALFAERLVNHCYKLESLYPLFIDAAKLIDSKRDKSLITNPPSTELGPREIRQTLYIHTEYHPRSLSRRLIRILYDTYLKEKSGFNKMIVCYSRPRNLRDKLIHTVLPNIPGRNPSNVLSTLKN